MDYQNNVLYLYGNAKVKFEDFELTADYIRVDREHNLLFASGARDHNNLLQPTPFITTLKRKKERLSEPFLK